jgi:hypothetical protein
MSRYSNYNNQIIDNGILFIIALFFLACVGCGIGNRGNCGCNSGGFFNSGCGC